MWKKLAALVIGVTVGYFLIDAFNPERIRGKNVLVTGVSTGIGKQIAYHYAKLERIRGKNVLVTGASTGIGEQIAYHYAKLGANVVVTARRENRLKQVVAKCRELGNKNQTFHYIIADMMMLNSTSTVIQETIKVLGGLDYLVLNHIALQEIGKWDGSSDNITLADRVITINFRSYVSLASYSMPHLKRSSGSIVVVNSLAGKFGHPFLSIYSASKFALDGFFSSLRQEMMSTKCDVSITSCVIGFIGTENCVGQLRRCGQDFIVGNAHMSSPSTENCVSQLRRYGQDFIVSNVHMSSPSDAAFAIIKGGAQRTKEIYFPYMEVRPMIIFRDWFPSILEFVIRSVFNSNAFT